MCIMFNYEQAYTKEYERKLGISADVETLTGAPFTIINKVCINYSMHTVSW